MFTLDGFLDWQEGYHDLISLCGDSKSKIFVPHRKRSTFKSSQLADIHFFYFSRHDDPPFPVLSLLRVNSIWIILDHILSEVYVLLLIFA